MKKHRHIRVIRVRKMPLKILKILKRIDVYRWVPPVGMIIGVIFLILGCVFFFFSSPQSELASVLLIAASMGLIQMSVWARLKVRDLSVGLEVRDRERKNVEHPVSPTGVESSTKLQYCPSCGKNLQPDWKVCGYCGKRLKKSGS